MPDGWLEAPAQYVAPRPVGDGGTVHDRSVAIVVADRLEHEAEGVEPERGEVGLRILGERPRLLHHGRSEVDDEAVHVLDRGPRGHRERQVLQARPVPGVSLARVSRRQPVDRYDPAMPIREASPDDVVRPRGGQA